MKFSVGEEDKKVRDGLVEIMRKGGIEVSMDDAEGQRVLDEEKGWVAMGRKNQPVIPSYRETNLLSKQLSYQVLTVQK